MRDKTRRDRIRNENIYETIGVVPIEDKLREIQANVIWLIEGIVKKSDKIIVNGNARKGKNQNWHGMLRQKR